MVSLHDSSSPPTSGIRHTEQCVDFYIESRKVGSGTLYITDENVVFMMETQSLEIQYENISVHAISRGGEGAEFPLPSLLMLVEGCLPAGLNANRDQVHQITGNGDAASAPDQAMEDESEGSGNDQSAPLSAEFHFVPPDSASLNTLYSMMVECQQLHPDPEMDDEDVESEGEGDPPFFRPDDDNEPTGGDGGGDERFDEFQ